MKKLFIGFLILLFAIWLGYLIHNDPGYILASYGSWSVETSLWVGIVILLVVFVLLHGLLRLGHHTANLAQRLQSWGKNRQSKRADERLLKGFSQLLQKNWADAEDLLKKSIKENSTLFICYLCAAQAAHQQKAYDRRDRYLHHAAKHNPSESWTLECLKLEYYIASQQWEAARPIVLRLHDKRLKEPYALNVCYHFYKETGDAQKISELLPLLEKHAVLTEKELQSALLHTAALKSSQDATALIEKTLKKTWIPELARMYGLTASEDTIKQLKMAESWLKKHPHDPELLLCIARLSMREQFWGKAKHYLETHITQKPSAEAYIALGQVCAALDEHAAALRYYQQGALKMSAMGQSSINESEHKSKDDMNDKCGHDGMQS